MAEEGLAGGEGVLEGHAWVEMSVLRGFCIGCKLQMILPQYMVGSVTASHFTIAIMFGIWLCKLSMMFFVLAPGYVVCEKVTIW